VFFSFVCNEEIENRRIIGGSREHCPHDFFTLSTLLSAMRRFDNLLSICSFSAPRKKHPLRVYHTPLFFVNPFHEKSPTKGRLQGISNEKIGYGWIYHDTIISAL
jgi:hypothetical protein